MKRIAGLLAGIALCAAAQAAAAQAPVPAVHTHAAADSVSTALAVFIGDVVNSTLADHTRMGFAIDRVAFVDRLADYLKGQPQAFDSRSAKEFLNSVYASMTPAEPEALPAADPAIENEVLAKADAEPGARTLPSGTVVLALAEGTGPMATEDGIIEMRYTGTLSDGRVFDKVRDDEAALDFPVAALAPGLTEALLSGLMRSGGKYRVTVPASAAYGDTGIPGKIPPGATLTFDIELCDAE